MPAQSRRRVLDLHDAGALAEFVAAHPPPPPRSWPTGETTAGRLTTGLPGDGPLRASTGRWRDVEGTGAGSCADRCRGSVNGHPEDRDTADHCRQLRRRRRGCGAHCRRCRHRRARQAQRWWRSGQVSSSARRGVRDDRGRRRARRGRRGFARSRRPRLRATSPAGWPTTPSLIRCGRWSSPLTTSGSRSSINSRPPAPPSTMQTLCSAAIRYAWPPPTVGQTVCVASSSSVPTRTSPTPVASPRSTTAVAAAATLRTRAATTSSKRSSPLTAGRTAECWSTWSSWRGCEPLRVGTAPARDAQRPRAPVAGWPGPLSVGVTLRRHAGRRSVRRCRRLRGAGPRRRSCRGRWTATRPGRPRRRCRSSSSPSADSRGPRCRTRGRSSCRCRQGSACR